MNIIIVVYVLKLIKEKTQFTENEYNYRNIKPYYCKILQINQQIIWYITETLEILLI